MWEWGGCCTSWRALTGERLLCFSLLNCSVQLRTLLSETYHASDICRESLTLVTSLSVTQGVRTQTGAGALGAVPQHEQHTRRGIDQKRRHIKPEGEREIGL